MIAGYTLIVPYYRNPLMLREQIRAWESYPHALQIVLVDDGSPEDAVSVVLEAASLELRERLRLYRIQIDIPWNRGGARNLGAHLANTDWLVHIDIDHVLPATSAWKLAQFSADAKHWYRFERYRNGMADDTRKKDKIPAQAVYGKIHPHQDSYLCTHRAYWLAGGYDEDYSGCLGGGSPFLRQLELAAGPALMAPADIPLLVYTRSTVPDSSDHTLSRDRTEYSRRRKAKERAGKTPRAERPLRFTWLEEYLCTPQ